MKAARVPQLLFLLVGSLMGQTAATQPNQAAPAAIYRTDGSRATAPDGAANSNPVKPEDQCLVEGKVFSATTGEPLKKAHVSLRRMDSNNMNTAPYGATTDPAGHFLIEKIDPGRYHLSADRTGFVRSDMSSKKLTTVPDTLTLSEGQKLGNLAFKLVPHAVVSGRVVDEDHEPVANVRVQCARYRYLNGKKTLMPMGTATTNDKGEYRAFGLAAGKYYVSATYMQFSMGPTEIRPDTAPEEEYVTTYYPDAIDTGGATQVNLVAGAETSSLDIRLLRARTFQISGRIVNPVASTPVQVMLMKHDSSGFNWESMKRGMTDAKGRFLVRGVSPGSYDLQAVEFRSDQQRVALSQVTVGNANVEDLELSFAIQPDLNGVLSIEDSPAQPSPAAAPSAQPTPNSAPAATSYHVALNAEVNMPMFGGAGGEVREDRTFALKNVMPQRYRIAVYPLEGDAFVKRVAVGDKECLDGRIDFSGGVEAGEIKVVLSMNGAQVEGSVVDAKHQPQPHATVVLVPDRTEATDRYKSGTTDQNGHYVLRGIAPGKYKLYALDQIDAGAYYDADYMKAFESHGEAVEVAEGSKLTHELPVIVNDEVL